MALTLGHFVPTSEKHVEHIVSLANICKSDVVLDLGSGDGQLLRSLVARTGCRGVGVEVNPDLHSKAEHACEAAGVTKSIELYRCAAEDLKLDPSGRVFLAEKKRKVFLPQVTIVYIFLMNLANNPAVMRWLVGLTSHRLLPVHVITNTFALPPNTGFREVAHFPDAESDAGMHEILSSCGRSCSACLFFLYRPVTAEETFLENSVDVRRDILEQMRSHYTNSSRLLEMAVEHEKFAESAYQSAENHCAQCNLRLAARRQAGVEAMRRDIEEAEAMRRDILSAEEQLARRRAEHEAGLCDLVRLEQGRRERELHKRKAAAEKGLRERWHLRAKEQSEATRETWCMEQEDIRSAVCCRHGDAMWCCLTCGSDNTGANGACVFCGECRGQGLCGWAHSDAPWESRGSDDFCLPLELDQLYKGKSQASHAAKHGELAARLREEEEALEMEFAEWDEKERRKREAFERQQRGAMEKELRHDLQRVVRLRLQPDTMRRKREEARRGNADAESRDMERAVRERRGRLEMFEQQRDAAARARQEQEAVLFALRRAEQREQFYALELAWMGDALREQHRSQAARGGHCEPGTDREASPGPALRKGGA